MIYSTQSLEIISKCQKKTFFKSLSERRLKMSQGKNCWNKCSTTSIWSFLHSLLVWCVHENQPAPLKRFTVKEMVDLKATVLLEHRVECSSHGAHPNSHGHQWVLSLSPPTCPSRPSHKGDAKSFTGTGFTSFWVCPHWSTSWTRCPAPKSAELNWVRPWAASLKIKDSGLALFWEGGWLRDLQSSFPTYIFLSLSDSQDHHGQISIS